jgi:hypothetical protein
MLAASSLSPRLLSRRSLLFVAHRSRTLPDLRLGALAVRSVGSASTPETPKPAEPVAFLDRVVNKLNASIKAHPAETLAVLFASDIGSIGAMYGVISVLPITFSPEFALAFAASRPFRRFRLPLDLAVAAGVTKVFPAFSKVRLSDLAGALPKYVEAASFAGGVSCCLLVAWG